MPRPNRGLLPHRQPRRQSRANVGVEGIIAPEKQAVVSRDSERIGSKTVADVHPRPVAAAADAPKCVDGDLDLLQRDADNVEAAITEQKFDVPPTRLTLATLYRKGKFDPAH